MNIKIGDKVNIRHFSNNSNYVVGINKIDGDNLHLKFIKKVIDFRLNVGDPAVLIFNSDSGIFIKGCIVTEVHQDEEIIVVRCDQNCSGISKRVYERYPVSYETDFRLLNQSKRYSAFIKDINKYGFKILTNFEMSVGQIIEISPYINKKTVFITATIVQCTEGERYFEYGAKLDVNDLYSVQELSKIIKLTQAEYVEGYITTDELKKMQISRLELAFDTKENKVIFESQKNLNEATVKLEDLIKRMRF